MLYQIHDSTIRRIERIAEAWASLLVWRRLVSASPGFFVNDRQGEKFPVVPVVEPDTRDSCGAGGVYWIGLL
ncbi:MAG: hypothetical protein V9H25_00590 [Candidatus Competibacter sp.]